MFRRRFIDKEQRQRFGSIIREEQKTLGLTQEDLAGILNCSPHWIANIESGISNPTWLDALRLIRALNLDAGKILDLVEGRVPEASN